MVTSMDRAQALETMKTFLREGNFSYNELRQPGPQYGYGQQQLEKRAWVFLPHLVELAVQLGVPRFQVDVPRGVFRDRKGDLHKRSDCAHAVGTEYVKVHVTTEDKLCANCGHVILHGRKGFDNQRLIKTLMTLCSARAYIEEELTVDELAERGSKALLEFHDTSNGYARTLEGEIRSLSYPLVTALATQLVDDHWAQVDLVKRAYVSETFRATLLNELEMDLVFNSAEGRQIPHLVGDQLITVRSGWLHSTETVALAYPPISGTDDFMGTEGVRVLQVPERIAALLAGRNDPEIIDGPVPAPTDLQVLETVLGLYTPKESGPLSRLTETVKAAEML